MANALDLRTERREILQALSHDEHALLVSDAHQEAEVAAILAKIGELNNESGARTELLQKLMNLYDSHDPPDPSILRSLLDYSYLLYRQNDIDEIIKPVVNELIKDAKNDEQLIDAFIHEVERYASSPFWATREVIHLLISALAKKNPEVASRLLKNERLDFETALFVVDLIVAKRLTTAYSAVAVFAERVCHGKGGDAYRGRIEPLTHSVCKMGRSGVELFAPVFERGGLGKQHGHTVMAAFGPEFCKWFLELTPRRSRGWARAAFSAALKASVLHKNRIISILLNDWCADGGVAELVREYMEDERDKDRRFLETLGAEARAAAEIFLGPYTPPRTAAEILGAANSARPIWDEFTERAVTRRQGGNEAAAAFAKGTDEVRVLVMEWVNRPHKNGRFVSGFFGPALNKGAFLRLPASAQMQILKSRHFKAHADVTRVREILQERTKLDPAVFKRLRTIAEHWGPRDVKAGDRNDHKVLR